MARAGRVALVGDLVMGAELNGVEPAAACEFAPECQEPARHACASCDRMLCDEHASPDPVAGERFCEANAGSVRGPGPYPFNRECDAIVDAREGAASRAPASAEPTEGGNRAEN